MQLWRNFRNNKRGVLVISSVLVLFLMLAVLSGILAAFFVWTQSTRAQMQYEQNRMQERIALSQQTSQQNTISNVTITNTGSIQVKITALYAILNNQTTFICDPSAAPLNRNTYISPTESLTINTTTYQINANANIEAATQRGTKSFYLPPSASQNSNSTIQNYNPTTLYVGPLMLKFDEFYNTQTKSDGSFDPKDTWHLGWTVNAKLPVSIAFNITVKNVSDRNITLNYLSAFNLLKTGSPSSLPWYLQPTNQVTYTQDLLINQTTSLVFIWRTPPPNAQTQTLTGTFSGSSCLVFLTLFGVYHNPDGTTTAYAQTIPFQASVTVGG